MALLLFTTRDVSGDRRVPSVVFESASRSTAAGRGFLLGGVARFTSPGTAGSAISFTLLGVGVFGGGVLVLCARPLLGVDDVFTGASLVTPFSAVSAPAFLLRLLCTGAGGGGGGGAIAVDADVEALSSEAALNLADLRVDIFAIRGNINLLPIAEGSVSPRKYIDCDVTVASLVRC
jgi:hypothetical protein